MTENPTPSVAEIRAAGAKALEDLKEAHRAQYTEMRASQERARLTLKAYYKDQVAKALRGEPVDEL